jgi:hypothetical protein
VEWHGLLAHAYRGDVAVDPLPSHGSHYASHTNIADFPDQPHGSHPWKSFASHTNIADFPDQPHGSHPWKSFASHTKQMLSGLYAREGVW